MPPHTPILQAASRHPILLAVGVCGVLQVMFPGAISYLLPEKLRSAFLDIPFPKQLRPLGMAFVDFAPRLRSLFRISGKEEGVESGTELTKGTVPVEEEATGEEISTDVEAAPNPGQQTPVEEGGGVFIGGQGEQHSDEQHHDGQHHDEQHHDEQHHEGHNEHHHDDHHHHHQG